MVAPHYNIQYSIYKLALKYLHDFAKSGDSWGKFRSTITQNIQNNNASDNELFQNGDAVTRQILMEDINQSAGITIPRHRAALNILETEIEQVRKKDKNAGRDSCEHLRDMTCNENLVQAIEASINEKRELMRHYDSKRRTIFLPCDSNEEAAISLVRDLSFLYQGHGGKHTKDPKKLTMYDEQYGQITINPSHADFMKAIMAKESQPHHLPLNHDIYTGRLGCS